MVRSMAERLAINAPLQGTSADFIRKAMNTIQSFLKREQTPLTLLLQIHDELLFEGSAQEIDRLTPVLKKKMVNMANLRVPITVNSAKGACWEDIY